MLLKRTELTKANGSSPPSKRQCLCCGTGKQNQSLKSKDVTVGNMETSAQKTDHQPTAGTVSRGRQCVERPLSSWGDSTLLLKRRAWTVKKYLDTSEMFAVPHMAHLQTKRFLSIRWWPFTLRPYGESLWMHFFQTGGLGRMDQSPGSLAPPL
jgi:hypothetical protein